MTVARPVRIGVVGGGLMGRELAMVCGRWQHLVDHPASPRRRGAADPQPAARDWFRAIPTVETFAEDWREIVDRDDIDVLYLAVPHDLHEDLYVAAARAGRDFLGEKPFGIDLAAAERITAAVEASAAFVRVSSEMPFFPGAHGPSRMPPRVRSVRSSTCGRSSPTRPTSTGASPSTGSAARPPAARSA